MSQINYTAMSDEELRQYFLHNRDDKTAMRAYFDRLSERPRKIITDVDDPEFDVKLQEAVLHQLKASTSNSPSSQH